jgi:hypothetical protein
MMYESRIPVTTSSWKNELRSPLIFVSDISAMYIGEATQNNPPQKPQMHRPTISISTAAGQITNAQPAEIIY